MPISCSKNTKRSIYHCVNTTLRGTVIDFKILLFYLWHGKYVHIVAQVNPGKTCELLGFFEGFTQIFKDAKSQTVPIESQCCEFGQCTQEGQK